MGVQTMKALVLDDDKTVCDFIASVLKESGVACRVFLDPLRALASMNGEQYDFAFVDIGLPKMDGLEFSKRFKDKHPDADIVFITGGGDYDKAIEAIRIGACDFMRKAFKRLDIRICVGRLVERRNLLRAQKKGEVLDFAASVSLRMMHELKNPLMVIGGFSRRAYGENCSEEKRREYAKIIFDQSLKLEKAFDQILEHLKARAEPQSF